MARREYTYSPQCVHDGCTERAHYYFATRREQHEQMDHLQKAGGWRCVRHTKPDEVLAIDYPAREMVLTSYAEDHGGRMGVKRYWRNEVSGELVSGFKHGPGFKAYADDFPTGTRLIVSARIEVPES